MVGKSLVHILSFSATRRAPFGCAFTSQALQRLVVRRSHSNSPTGETNALVPPGPLSKLSNTFHGAFGCSLVLLFGREVSSRLTGFMDGANHLFGPVLQQGDIGSLRKVYVVASI